MSLNRDDMDRDTDLQDSQRTKPFESEKHLEHVDVLQGGQGGGDLAYDDAEHEPELHIRTWLTLAAMCVFNYGVVFALLSPPAVVR